MFIVILATLQKRSLLTVWVNLLNTPFQVTLIVLKYFLVFFFLLDLVGNLSSNSVTIWLSC